METQDVNTTILVDKSPEEVFNAINSPQNWWSGEFTGSSENLNDEFTYRYKDIHYSRQRVAELIPNKKVVWLVTESQLNFIEDKNEWAGTKIVFEISKKDGQTQVIFTHYGIVPQVECYNDCNGAWTSLVQQSLFKYITTGESQQIALD